MSQSFSDHSTFAPMLPPVVTFSVEQTEAKMVELRDAEGKSLGFFVPGCSHSVYYSPEYIAELKKRSASGERGRTLREVLDTVAQQMSHVLGYQLIET